MTPSRLPRITLQLSRSAAWSWMKHGLRARVPRPGTGMALSGYAGYWAIAGNHASPPMRGEYGLRRNVSVKLSTPSGSPFRLP